MPETTDIELKSDSLDESDIEDKTSEKNDNNLDDLPSEDDELGIEDKDEDDSEKKKSESVLLAQKKHWRGKALKAQAEAKRLAAELTASKKRVDEAGGELTEKEKAAQAYIRKQAKDVFDELKRLEAQEQAQVLSEFEGKVATVLEDNPDIKEEDLLDVVEDFNVEPEVAARIIKRGTETSKPKPRMPKARQGTASVRVDKKEQDKGKTLFQIAQDVKKDLRDKFGL